MSRCQWVPRRLRAVRQPPRAAPGPQLRGLTLAELCRALRALDPLARERVSGPGWTVWETVVLAIPGGPGLCYEAADGALFIRHQARRQGLATSQRLDPRGAVRAGA
jgi:hypothetical protein